MAPETVATFVVDLLRRLHLSETINENSEFGVDINTDENLRTLYYYAIVIELESKGYKVHMLTPEACTRALTVQDIIDNIIADKQEQ